MDKEIKKQLRNVIKTLKADIKLNQKEADKAYKNYKEKLLMCITVSARG